ncbi:hypothetical protein BDV97DRAFT_361359 [Delphinella strobiligena]|nr:hypothetical protein BDV97DRAFT_361359 [Delphinella strobiligena]
MPPHFQQPAPSQKQHDLPRQPKYFFYGSLMDAGTLQSVLECAERPRLLSATAKIRGYECKMWGMYPAIIRITPRDEDGDEDETIPGKLYEPSPLEHIDAMSIETKLRNWEGANYRLISCIVQVEGIGGIEGEKGEKVEGWRFERWRIEGGGV